MMAVQEEKLQEMRETAAKLCAMDYDRVITAIIKDTPAMDLEEACALCSDAGRKAGVTINEINDFIHQHRAAKY